MYCCCSQGAGLRPPERQLSKNSKREKTETEEPKRTGGERYQWSGIFALCWESDSVIEGLSGRCQRNWVQASIVKYPVDSCINVFTLKVYTSSCHLIWPYRGIHCPSKREGRLKFFLGEPPIFYSWDPAHWSATQTLSDWKDAGFSSAANLHQRPRQQLEPTLW